MRVRSMIESERVRCLNHAPVDEDGRYVLYWMQQSQREAHNPALEHAIRRGNELGKPVPVSYTHLRAHETT